LGAERAFSPKTASQDRPGSTIEGTDGLSDPGNGRKWDEKDWVPSRRCSQSATGNQAGALDAAGHQPYRSGMEPQACGSVLTASEFASLPNDDCRHELEAGWVISEPFPSLRHDEVRKRLERILDTPVARRRLGAIFGNVGFVLARDPDTVRGPDLSFVARERLVGIDYSRFFEGAPDLAIEILSPSNRPYQVRAKVADYLAAGCRLVWVVNPERRIVTSYRALLTPRVLVVDEELDGEDVLPGLRVAVGSIFESPRDVEA
jgi:Uma2 family endonuclease